MFTTTLKIDDLTHVLARSDSFNLLRRGARRCFSQLGGEGVKVVIETSSGCSILRQITCMPRARGRVYSRTGGTLQKSATTRASAIDRARRIVDELPRSRSCNAVAVATACNAIELHSETICTWTSKYDRRRGRSDIRIRSIRYNASCSSSDIFF